MFTTQPLFGLELFIFGDTSIPRTDLERRIRAMGGKTTSRIHRNLVAIISKSDEADVYTESEEAFTYRIQVIPDKYFCKSNDVGSVKKDSSQFGILVSKTF